MHTLTVIVPVYNVEKYIHQCVDSLLAQDYPAMEILLIDDGSPDGCPQICDDYAKKDSRVRVIHQKNQGGRRDEKYWRAGGQGGIHRLFGL